MPTGDLAQVRSELVTTHPPRVTSVRGPVLRASGRRLDVDARRCLALVPVTGFALGVLATTDAHLAQQGDTRLFDAPGRMALTFS